MFKFHHRYMRFFNLSAILFFLASFSYASASEIQVKATVDQNQITIEDQVVLTISVSGTRSSSKPMLPELPDFDVSSEGTSSSVQIINGKMTSKVTYRYLLFPKDEGTFTIKPAVVKYKGKIYKTSPITIWVKKTLNSQSVNSNIFVMAEVDNSSPYVGEEILFTFKFFRRVNVSNASLQEMKFEGFQSEDVGKEKSYAVVSNGLQYSVTEIKKILTPVDSGHFTIPSFTLRCEIPSSRDSFNDFFNSNMRRGKTKNLRSKPIEIDVKGFPEEGKPEHFSGIVGRDVKLSAEISKKSVKERESLTLTMTLSGEGNLSGALRPNIDGIEDFKHYDDQPVTEKKAKNGKIISKKTFKTALVPLETGKKIIKEISSWIFNTKTEKYEKITSGPLSFNVTPSEKKENLQISSSPEGLQKKLNIKIVGKDILPIFSGIEDLKNERFSPVSVIPVTFFLSPILIFSVALFYKKRSDKYSSDEFYALRKGAMKRVKVNIKVARSLAGESNPKELYVHLAKTLQTYLGAKANTAGETKTPDELISIIRAKTDKKEIVDNVSILLKELEYRQFAPSLQNADESKKMIDELEKLILTLEKVL